jgi:hypothetical protein
MGADSMAKEPQELVLLTDDGGIAAPPALVSAGLETLSAKGCAEKARPTVPPSTSYP